MSGIFHATGNFKRLCRPAAILFLWLTIAPWMALHAQDGPQIAPGMRAKKPDFKTFDANFQRVTPELEKLATADDRRHPEFGWLPWDAPCSNCVELPERRTETGRYFVADGSGGEHFYLQESAGPLHFMSASGQWLTRNPHLRPSGKAGVFHAPSQPLPTRLDLNAGHASITLANGFEFQFKGAEALYGESAQSPGAEAGKGTDGSGVEPGFAPPSAPASPGSPVPGLAPPSAPTSPDPAPASPGSPDRLSRVSVGRDGMRAYHAWPGIDLVQVFREGEIETDFVIRNAAALPPGDRTVFRDRWTLPLDYSISTGADGGEWISAAGGINTGTIVPISVTKNQASAPGLLWTGGLVISLEGRELLRLRQPVLYDQARANSLETPGLIGYRWFREGDELVVETVVDASWMRAAERQYPVVVDPLLYGVATYTGGDIGFNYDATCFDVTDFCNASLTVTVPGKTTLTGAWFDAQYFSVLMGCIAGMTDCLMREAAFQIVGPCSTSPFPGSYWSCLPPEGDSAGTCYGDSLDMFPTIACIPPSCADHVLNFEMRTFHCSCNGPNCGVICHFMPDATWKITIEGRTVEESFILSPDEPDFTICEGDTIALTPTAQWGVPPYEYHWSPVGLVADTIFVSPLINTTYTSVVFDVCDNTDTVTRDVTVIPAPNPAPGPFEDCFPSVTLDAGSGFVSYLWPHSGETTQTVTVTLPGNYTVQVTDANGCTGFSEPIVAIINAPPVINTVPDTIIIDEGALAQLMVSSTATGLVNYTWSPPGTLTCLNCPSPLAFPETATVYYVIGEQSGCVGEPDSVLVLVNKVNLVLPNAFTPNGDGLNDVFRVTNPVLYPVFEMKIFNRWGEEVFSAKDIRTGWDGTYRGHLQEIGAYVWTIMYRKGRENGEEVNLRGSLTLLR